MSAEDTRKVAELIKGERFGFLTTTAPGGKLTSRPMTLQEVEFDGDLWFYAERGSHPVEHVTASPQVNVGIGSGGTWVSLTGHARVVDDLAKKKELWNGGVEAWFPGGPEDPDVVLIKVEGESAEYWDSPGGRLATAFSFVKAKATGERIDAGENRKVDL
ncbi:pyridoxamine 5'-phosphate oxidase [Blastococcus sp. MG754426]|uniref:pyridoxamine 5'-phosphate oxidase family protein n=1 Tax=unclassified Blastococcus TaxID=2619396 RepID=UPI001EF02EB8|nr:MULTISPECIES: pyridoxamine 5'-phosphate oxidase family protein [unclassified Blastococcus]MCF6506743.1 pyridoxamine 5'-phosphate oxidase [Blastococcus sp. MG754426]MCF6511314.1 pyridoxamine 5'-phosphate oxidase [Blastococcus sp. MG754427]MCF6734768.1 pyridoxamine 5'-phosphate oxidase [Blastococcus sp. KM273129]